MMTVVCALIPTGGTTTPESHLRRSGRPTPAAPGCRTEHGSPAPVPDCGGSPATGPPAASGLPARRSCRCDRRARLPTALATPRPTASPPLPGAARMLPARRPSSCGAGRPLRSSFPFGVSGNRSSLTNAAGTMYCGKHPSRYARSWAARSPGRRSLPSSRHHIRHQALLPRLVLPCQHRRFSHPRVLPQTRLDLSRLDPEAPDLHLLIVATQELQAAIRPIPAQIPGPVQPCPWLVTERILDKALRRQLRSVQIPSCNPGSSNVDLPDRSQRHRPPVRVQTDRYAGLTIAALSGYRIARHPPAAVSGRSYGTVVSVIPYMFTSTGT